jgi:hypothetical protein
MPRVNAAGSTWAVVAGLPSRCWSSASRATQSGSPSLADPPSLRRALAAMLRGVEPAIAPLARELGGEHRMQLEASPRERRERRAVAPVERQKAAGLARRGAGDAGALDDGGLDTPLAQEIRDRGANHAATTDQHPHRCASLIATTLAGLRA